MNKLKCYSPKGEIVWLNIRRRELPSYCNVANRGVTFSPYPPAAKARAIAKTQRLTLVGIRQARNHKR